MDSLLETAAQICERYQIADLRYFVEACRSFARAGTLNVAVFGRFKAGKSSFLNHLLGAPLLPVGVIPVTSVITEIAFGPAEKAEVRFLDGSAAPISMPQIADYISETTNPGNARKVAAVRIELPAMEPYRGICFVDTPGLESVHAHDTEASIAWLPNTGLALVAVGVDPPLSRHDLDLIARLSRFTPNVSVLLTKVDTLATGEREQVRTFVIDQLARCGDGPVPVFPYSIRPGFEHLREQLDRQLLSQARAHAGDRHAAILRHKTAALLTECRGYLTLALKAAELDAAEKIGFGERLTGHQSSLEDLRLNLRLIVRHAAEGSRRKFEELLSRDEADVRERLLHLLEREFPAWTGSLAIVMARFEEWLPEGLRQEIAALSHRHRAEFLEPACRAGRQVTQTLQDFRNRLAKLTLESLGVPLETTQVDLNIADPISPDIRIGRIFDHNWELLSAAAPMVLLRAAVKRHFARRIAELVRTNLSRLAAQWEEAIGEGLSGLQKDSLARLDILTGTIERLVTLGRENATRIRADLDRIASIQ